MVANSDLMNRTGLVTDWRGPAVAVQRLRGVESQAILARFGQKPGRQLGTRSGQRAEPFMVGVLRKELFDLLTVVV
jgi:hypothetical protein